jgi:hypothetical protein
MLESIQPNGDVSRGYTKKSWDLSFEEGSDSPNIYRSDRLEPPSKQKVDCVSKDEQCNHIEIKVVFNAACRILHGLIQRLSAFFYLFILVYFF